MAGSSGRRWARAHALKHVVTVVACALVVAACADSSYLAEAMQAAERGDQKTAISLAKKEAARFDKPEQCSRTTRLNCGTLALTYGTLAGYQILDGDTAAGEGSFSRAKGALSLTDPENKASATGMVYRDVSEAFWKTGDRSRAVAVFNEGRAAGADSWLYMSAAGRAAAPQPPAQPPPEQQPTDQQRTEQAPTGQPPLPKALRQPTN